jgi:hypothetical protein
MRVHQAGNDLAEGPVPAGADDVVKLLPQLPDRIRGIPGSGGLIDRHQIARALKGPHDLAEPGRHPRLPRLGIVDKQQLFHNLPSRSPITVLISAARKPHSIP